MTHVTTTVLILTHRRDLHERCVAEIVRRNPHARAVYPADLPVDDVDVAVAVVDHVCNDVLTLERLRRASVRVRHPHTTTTTTILLLVLHDPTSFEQTLAPAYEARRFSRVVVKPSDVTVEDFVAAATPSLWTSSTKTQT